MDEIISYQPGKDRLFYEVLNCTPQSSTEQITTEYRILIRKFHPDKISSKNNAQEQKYDVELLNEAYSILRDPIKRNLYDQWKASKLTISFETWKNKAENSGQV
eukprot:Sdes_comp17539_c0_seq2m6785